MTQQSVEPTTEAADQLTQQSVEPTTEAADQLTQQSESIPTGKKVVRQR